MALGLTERLKIIFDVETQSFKQGMRTLKSDLASADGALGKAKVGAKALGDQLGQYGAQAALAAGAALVAFGAKSVQAFTDSALAAGKFADATGLTTEDASRLIEVAGDLGVSAEAVQSSIQRVNNAAAKGDLAAFGIEMAKTKDGAYDANQTFLNTIEAIGGIASAAEREAAARKLMGRSWAELAEMATMSAEDLAKALGEVSDEKVFDDAEVARAREYRAAMDNLRDAIEDITLAVGEELTPRLTEAAQTFTDVNDGIDSLTGSSFVSWLSKADEFVKNNIFQLDKLGKAVNFVDESINGTDLDAYGEGWGQLVTKYEAAERVIQVTTDATTELADETEALTDATDAAAESNEAATRTHEALTEALKDQYDAARDSTDATIDYEQSVIGLEQSVDDYRASLAEATKDGEVSREELLDLASAHNDLKSDVLDSAAAFAESQGATEGSTEAAKLQIEELERLKVKFPELAPFIDGHIAKLNAIPRTIETRVTVVGNGTIVDENGNVRQRAGSRAAADPAGTEDTPGRTGTFVQNASNAWAAALRIWGALFGGGSESDGDKMPSQRDLFAKEFERARRRYEIGDLTAPAYLRVLQRLKQKYKFKRLSAPWMTLWREIKSVKEEIAKANEPDPVDDSPAWDQAAENQAAIEAAQNLRDTAAEAYADLTDKDPANDARALDAWASAIWRDIEARANAKYKRNKGRAWARFARRQLEKAQKLNPMLSSRLAVFLAGIPVFPSDDKGDDRADEMTEVGVVGPSAGTGMGGLPGGPPGLVGGPVRSAPAVHLHFPDALIVDGPAVDKAVLKLAPAIERAMNTRRRQS